MAELLVQDTSLIAIANAIRQKTEKSGNIVFPSGFVNAINAIVTGGGLPNGVKKVDAGTYVPSTNDTQIVLSHNLGEAPNFAMYIVDVGNSRLPDFGTFALSGLRVKLTCFVGAGTQLKGVEIYCFSNSSYVDGKSHNVASVGDASTFTIYNEKPFKSGITVRWIAGVIDGI